MRDFRNASKDFAKLPNHLRLATTRAFVKTGLVGEKRAKGIAELEAYDTGAFLRSIGFEIEQLPKSVKMMLGSTLEYAFYLKKGRKPGKFPNLDAMVAWTGRKLREQGINTRVTVSFDQLQQLAKSSSGKQKQAYRQHLSFLYLVGRKIATKGIREKRIFGRIEDGLKRYFIEELTKELRAIL